MTHKRTGRPKLAEHEKVSYQRIAVVEKDYLALLGKIENKNRYREPSEKIKLIDAFNEMVANYS